MILVFGGTTEGKRVAGVLDFLGEPYFYSTKTQTSAVIKGKLLSGDMDYSGMSEFCRAENIKLIIDAAHPFAEKLHENVYKVSVHLGLATIRYERTYPETGNNKNIRVFPCFPEMIEALSKSRFNNILSLTGVQTIPYYLRLKKNQSCYFRILDTGLSKKKAKSYGINDEYLILSHTNFTISQLIEIAGGIKADVLTSKESGDSGLFRYKIEAAEQLNIPLWVVKRPVLPEYGNIVCSRKSLLQLLYKLKKNILKTGHIPRTGFTTGTCVTAAAKACFIALANKTFPSETEVILPEGEKASFLVFPEKLDKNKASCVVIKDAGDDPDITHSKEIGCELSFTDKPGIRFLQGKGIGSITLPGLQLEVGEPAINPVPRKMISSMLEEMSALYEIDSGFDVKPFVPEGEEIAKQTFNPRLGVVGGISVLGTSGKVIPYSNEAFLSTVKYQLTVAKENGLEEIVLTSGKRSENILHPDFSYLPETAFIHYGNLIGKTIQEAVQKGIKKITLGVMLGKAMKLTEGHLDTHSKNVLFNADFAGQIALECGYPDAIVQKIRNLKLANAICTIVPFSETERFYVEVARRCYGVCEELIPEEITFWLFLITEQGDKLKVIPPYFEP